MPIHIDDYEQIIDGPGGDNINGPLEDAIKRGIEENSRIKVYFRVQETGTPSLRKVQEFRFDPSVSDIHNIKKIIVQKLGEDPGPEFSGKIKIEFQNATNSSTYSSFQRSVKIGALAEGGNFNEEDDGMNSVNEMFNRRDESPMMDDRLIQIYEKRFAEYDRDSRAKSQQVEAAFGYVFKMLSAQQAMFDRATRMLENYTLRFGFPTGVPGIMDIHGSGNREPVQIAQKEAQGDGGMGMLPMLIKLAGQLATGGGGGSAPPQPQPQPQPQQNRMGGVMQGANAVQSMRPRPARPADGAGPPPPLPDPTEGHRFNGLGEIEEERGPRRQITDRHRHQEEEDDEDDRYERMSSDDGDDDGGDDGGSGGAVNQFNELDPESMKQLVLGWVRAKPENKSAAMDMGMELVNEITGG